ncbi:MAG: phosphoribosylamine--glycine ligase/phosphoribosylformylglycinamidine cyclo-ligase, partial [Alphaproteobacteria bacterium]
MSSITYKDAGVDIEAGNMLVKKIAPMIEMTKRAGVMSQIGGFGGLFDLKAENYTDPVLVSGTDGVGTKLKIAIDCGIHHTVGIDLVAMCVNDILVQGAQPLFFMDYFATGGLDVAVASEVIQGIITGCQQSGAALLGGETAEMPDFYPKDHYDLAGFCVGAVEREQILPQNDHFKADDILIGLPSSGFHSNGFSLVRKVAQIANLTYQDKCPWDSNQSLGEALLVPTIIYVNSVMPLLKKNIIKGMAHITGGGLSENLPRIMRPDLSFEVNLDSWDLPECFAWVQKSGNIDTHELLKTFNCGIGMVLVIDSLNFDEIQE